MSRKRELSDLTEQDKNVIVQRDFVLFETSPMSQVDLQPPQLELLIRVQGWIINFNTSEFTEMVRNVECLEVEVCILEIDESHS